MSDFQEWANIIGVFLLAISIGFAVQQGFFEDAKCEKWAEEKVFEIQMGSSPGEKLYQLVPVEDNLLELEQRSLNG